MEKFSEMIDIDDLDEESPLKKKILQKKNKKRHYTTNDRTVNKNFY